jgi:hypothetical protein
MMVITDAAPGLVPHSAVVPGSTCQRVISQPIRVEIATTASTPTVNRNQWPSTSPTIDSGTILAIRQPTMPCARTKGVSGMRTLPPFEATTIAATSGPSISAAGACSQSSRAARPIDKLMSAAQLLIRGNIGY